MRIAISISLMIFGLTSEADGFEKDGLRSGMPLQQFQHELRGRGQDVWDGMPANWAFGKRKDSQVNGTAFFCDGKLAGYNFNVDFDNEYVATVRGLLDSYGQPKRTSIMDDPWTGPGGGRIQQVQTVWYAGADRIALSVAPEGRGAKGELRYNRSVAVQYANRDICSSWKNAAWW